MNISVQINGLDTIDADFSDEKARIAAAVQGSMDIVGERMKDALKFHIETDVYDMYTPRVYKRRSENLLYGTPLNDMDANTFIFNKGAGVTLLYRPTGDHEIKKWSGADGADLVGRIENKNPAYRWGNDKIPARPFFQNFVSEMTDEGELERYFIEAMADNGVIVERDGSGVIRESNDGEY